VRRRKPRVCEIIYRPNVSHLGLLHKLTISQLQKKLVLLAPKSNIPHINLQTQDQMKYITAAFVTLLTATGVVAFPQQCGGVLGKLPI
jgi:hypothetical protein